ncbi:glycerol-3-phosphate dehydrogenase C-terminal domain-containing protein, partial [Actinomyces sp. oral taxon 171]
ARLGEPLAEAPTYLRAEVAWAVTHEGAESLDDVLLRRVRLDLSRRDRGLAAADEILAIMAPLLSWSEDDVAAQKEAYAQRVAQIAAAEAELTDAAAVAHISEPI